MGRGTLSDAQWARIEGPEGVGHVIVDAACDAGHLRALILNGLGAEAHIHANPSRVIKRPHDPALYAGRHKVENFFHRITRFRRIAPRCEKTLTRSMGVAFPVPAPPTGSDEWRSGLERHRCLQDATLFTNVLKKFWTYVVQSENKGLTKHQGDAAMTRIADILIRSRETLIHDVAGVLTLAAFTVGMLHLPVFV